MKKLFNGIDKKITIAMFIILTLLSTFLIAYAVEVTTEMYSEGTEGTSETINFEGKYLTLEDLKERYDILCCYHGGDHSHLASVNAAILEAGGSSTTVTDSGKKIGELVSSDAGNQTALTVKDVESIPNPSPYTASSYSAESWAWYEATEIIITKPENSYILAEMTAEVDPADRFKVFYDDGYTTIQHAWWTTEANLGSIKSTNNALSDEATAFEDYIRLIAKSMDVNSYPMQHYEIHDPETDEITEEGEIKAPELAYEPEFNEDANQDGTVEKDDDGNPTGKDKVTVTFDNETNTYTIGPFSVNYVEESFRVENPQVPQDQRDPVQFAGITNVQLFTNLGEVPFAIKEDKDNIDNPTQEVEGAKWKFNFLKDQRELDDNYRFPHANEVFYIELDYIEDATKITNFHFDFKYMNAGGRYEKLEGTYYRQTWTPNAEVTAYCPGTCGHSSHGEGSTCDGRCSHGRSSRHPIKWNYWLDLTGMEEKTAQLLGYGVKAARWYNYAKLDLEDKIDVEKEKQWNYKIEKTVVDENGNKVSTNKKFAFEVYKDGSLFDTVLVSGNVPFLSSTYTVPKGENIPTVTIKEAFDDSTAEDYELVSVDTQSSEADSKTSFVFKATNKEIQKHGSISLYKEYNGGKQNLEFQFKLYIDNELFIGSSTSPDGIITIKPNTTWNSGDIPYTLNSPKYRIEEVNVPEGVKLLTITNREGKLINGEPIVIKAVNVDEDEEYEHANISIKKVLSAGESSNETFKVKLTVGDTVYTKELKAGQTWSDKYTWKKGTPAPKYSVDEVDIPDGWKLVDINNKSGTLEPGTNIDIIIENGSVSEKSGYLEVKKEIETNDKIGVDTNVEFTFAAKISGTFEYGSESVANGTKTVTFTLKPDGTWKSEKISWKGDAPTYVLSETSLPEGWKQLSFSSSSGSLRDGITITAVCTNKYQVTVEYDLTMAMSGIVWEDAPLNPEDKNGEDSVANGLHDSSELGIQNVEVKIWKVLYNGQTEVGRELAKGYEENSDTEITFPIYTSADGIWEAPRMSVPGLTDEEEAQGITRADYDVEFIYDGQTYKPTKFLASGSAAAFKRADNAGRDKYNRDSMAIELESERESFDNKFAVITGDSPISSDGSTDGYAVGSDGGKTDLLYYSTDSIPSLDGNTRKISELQTLEEGYIREQFKMPSRTSTGKLTWPFDNQYHLEYIEKYINKIEGGLVEKYHYSATYPYLLNINLGLVKRDEAELSVTKDVYSANVVVNQKLTNYKFNEYVDFENEKYADYLNFQLKAADANIAYKLDLYQSDYYYRAKVYEDDEVNGALQEFYRSLGKDNISDELDLDVFLTYKVDVYNNSDSYLAKVQKVVDYFDEDLELVESDVKRYVQEADGKQVDAETTIVTPSYLIKKGPTGDSMWAEQLRQSLAGKISANYGAKVSSTIDIGVPGGEGMEASPAIRAESNKNYYKAEVNLDDDGLILKSGEKLEIFLTFRVRTDETPARFGDTVDEAVASYVRLGTKSNVAEIASYSTYYADSKKIAGKVEKDSAPNNVDITNKNDKTWYEDDTDSAPIITLDLYTETRDVSGLAWEDSETEKIDYNQVIGNGVYDAGERLIGNLTTEMVEKITVKQADGTYKDYDFVWPTDKTFNFLNGKTINEITGFDSITLTSNTDENKGEYGFKNIPAGNYVVRFVYGQFPSNSFDADGNLVKIDGASESQTSDDNARQPAVYNGQDFKTTAFETDVKEADGKTQNISNSDGYIDKEWYDFATCVYDADGNIIARNNDAIDNEARRLEVVAYSRELNNENTTILATANDYTADHTELYKNTYMYADTQKINLTIENMHSLKGQKVTVTDGNDGVSKEVGAAGEEDINTTLTNYVYGKSDVNGAKGTVSVVNYKYKVEAIDIGLEERSNTEIILDKEIESITVTTNSGDVILKAIYDIDYEFTLDPDTGKTSYKANVVLNRDKSFGTENLLAQNKDEENGVQNFRYIYYDDTIAQSLNLEVLYRFTALDLGEVDRTSEWLENAKVDEILAKAEEIKDQTYVKNGDTLKSVKHPNIGEYMGSIYYIGKNEAYNQKDIVVTTKVRQLIDYVDNDAVFKASDNRTKNGSWKNVTAEELYDNKVIDRNIIKVEGDNKYIVDDRDVLYTTNDRNNLVLSVDNTTGEELTNPDFIVKLVPYAASTENGKLDKSCNSDMSLTMTRSIDSEISDDDLAYDNIAEIVKLENTVGKRDIETIAGNADPKEGEFKISLEERDASATELITFTPPTGLDTNTAMMTELLIVVLAGLAIIVLGIVVIKRTVLKK